MFFLRRDFLRFMIAGGSAMVFESALYMLLYSLLSVSNVISTAVAWAVTVVFCFILNKYYVYSSPGRSGILHEFLTFFSMRGGTGVMNLVWMYVAVDLLSWPPLLMKILSASALGILNYYMGRLVIFQRKCDSDKVGE